MTETRSSIGSWGESATVNYLIEQGWQILARNYHSRYGEIDIVACRRAVVACVEVKTRRKNYFSIASVVTYQKQRKIVTTAKIFLSERKLTGLTCRFDVATVEGTSENPIITYLENAFYGE